MKKGFFFAKGTLESSVGCSLTRFGKVIRRPSHQLPINDEIQFPSLTSVPPAGVYNGNCSGAALQGAACLSSNGAPCCCSGLISGSIGGNDPVAVSVPVPTFHGSISHSSAQTTNNNIQSQPAWTSLFLPLYLSIAYASNALAT